MKVILDTNALMIPGHSGVDIFAELERLGYNEFMVPSVVIDELEKLGRKLRGKDRIAAKVALKLVHKCEIVEASGVADKAILGLAIEKRAAVLTGDKDLKRELADHKITVVYLRQKNRLST